MAGKCVDLRIFRDEEGRTNRSLVDVGGAMLVVSQFTLFGDTRKGRRPVVHRRRSRPSWPTASSKSSRRRSRLAASPSQRGVFGAEMEVELINDGPMTIWLDTES